MNTLKRLKCRSILYILFVITFVTYLFLSNYFISGGFNSPTKKANQFQIVKHDKVYASLDIVREIEPFKEITQFAGWAFCKTALPNEQRQVKIYLVSDKDTYEISFGEYDNRQDVVESYMGKNVEIRNPLVGFDVLASTVLIKEGIYSLYIYCWENEQNYGMADTGRLFRKEGKKFYEYQWKSEEVENKEKTQELPAKADIGVITATKAEINFSGWCLVEAIDSTNQQVYLRLSQRDGKTATYTTLARERSDVAAYFKNDIYLNSGFEAVISPEGWTDGEISATLLVEIDGEIYEAPPRTVLKNGDQWKLKK